MSVRQIIIIIIIIIKNISCNLIQNKISTNICNIPLKTKEKRNKQKIHATESEVLQESNIKNRRTLCMQHPSSKKQAPQTGLEDYSLLVI
jgi:hypothetical protein